MLAIKYADGLAPYDKVPSKLSILACIAETEDQSFIQSSVKNISLHFHPIGISGISSIASIMRHCSYLDNLDFVNCGLSADGAGFMWRNIAHSSLKINKLSVSRNRELGNGFQHICEIAAHCDVQELRACGLRLRYSQFSCLKDIKSSQLRVLDLYGNDLSEVIFSVIGAVIDNGGELFLPEISPTIVSGVQLLEKALEAKKLKGLHIGTAIVEYLSQISSLDLSYSEFDAPCYKVIGNIVKACSIDKLSLEGCRITDDALNRFLLAAKRAKISSLDLSLGKFDAPCCVVIGNIVECCSIDKLSLLCRQITDDALDHFLSAAKGAKLTELDLSYNPMSQAAIERIEKSITVKSLHF